MAKLTAIQNFFLAFHEHTVYKKKKKKKKPKKLAITIQRYINVFPQSTRISACFQHLKKRKRKTEHF